jgi:hypothetical protein
MAEVKRSAPLVFVVCTRIHGTVQLQMSVFSWMVYDGGVI